VRVHVWAGLFTAGFGTLWGDEEELRRPRSRYRWRANASLLLQAVALPILALLEVALLVVPPLCVDATTREWLRTTLAMVRGEEGGLSALVGTDRLRALTSALMALPWWEWILAAIWWLSLLLSCQLAVRRGRLNLLWRPTTMYKELLRPQVPPFVVAYARLLGWLTHLCWRHRRTLGCVGEVALLPIVVAWVGWPASLPLLLRQPLWLLLAVPVVLLLTWGAARLLRSNWRPQPQYLNDNERDRIAAHERAEARHARFFAKREARRRLERVLFAERTISVAITAAAAGATVAASETDSTGGSCIRSSSDGSGVRGGGSSSSLSSSMAPIGRRGRSAPANASENELAVIARQRVLSGSVSWSRDHAGAVSDPARWAGVSIPFDAQTMGVALEHALLRGDAGCPLGTGSATAMGGATGSATGPSEAHSQSVSQYVDLERLWDGQPGSGACELLTPMRRRALPPMSHFAIRELATLASAASDRPERFVHRTSTFEDSAASEIVAMYPPPEQDAWGEDSWEDEGEDDLSDGAGTSQSHSTAADPLPGGVRRSSHGHNVRVSSRL